MQQRLERYSSYVAAKAAQGILRREDNSDGALVATMIVRNKAIYRTEAVSAIRRGSVV